MGDNSAGQDPSRPVIDIYARLSYSVNGETIQVDDQVEMGEETVARRGAVVGAVFKDPSKSAWHPRVIRPQWEALMARLESGASGGVWVYDLTRFLGRCSKVSGQWSWPRAGCGCGHGPASTT
jgi:hypothetical protein